MTLQVETPVGSIGVVGVLLESTPTTWSIRRRDGSVAPVDVAAIRACRIVPPGRAARVSVADLERVAALGWRGREVAQLGDWTLRAGGGYTSRANSALAVGDPGLRIAGALDAVSAWYAERGLPTKVQLVDRDAPPGLLEELDHRAWEVITPSHVMTAELGHVLRAVAAPTDLEVRLDDAPDDAWLGCYRQDSGATPPAALAILTNHPNVVFASLRDGDDCIAIARGAVDGRWCGIHAVEVDLRHRGHGLGALVTAAAVRWCGQRGSRLAYLQVSHDNAAAFRLYERLNFAVHHNYVYRGAPAA